MSAWIAALVFIAQTAPGPLGSPALRPQGQRGTLDASVQAAFIADLLPRRDVVELRPRIAVELTATPRTWVTIRFDARADAIVADRGDRVADVRGEIRDAWVEVRGAAGDLRAGYGRLAWGRLDEIAPTDVVGPLDAARFLFEGRSEARLPVSFVRGRLTSSERFTVEGVVVPFFRRGLFDRLDESTSPFNLVNEAVRASAIEFDRRRREPDVAWRNVSGGGRIDATVGRLDFGVSAFRGFDGLGPVILELPSREALEFPVPLLIEEHPRFTMIGGDFETVRGSWAWRGEAAVFPERSFAAAPASGLVRGRSMDAGVGFDRRVGEFRLFGSGIFHRQWSLAEPAVEQTDFSVVGSIERSFDRDHYFARAFAVVNPGDAAVFVRGVLAWKPTDRWSLDTSGGAFLGTSDDAIGRFKTRDFLLVALRAWIW